MAAIADSYSILVINPNTTVAMTEALKVMLSSLQLSTVNFEYFTAPVGPASINDLADGKASSEACLPHLVPLLPRYSAFLVACYSPHPLVPDLRQAIKAQRLPTKAVCGIFEASIATCLANLSVDEKFGIVSTGSQWQDILNDGVAALLGSDVASPRYAGTETTGFNADELHNAPKDELEMRMKAATKKLLNNGAKAVCLGCAGMTGLDNLVREASIEALGLEDGARIRIVDGVKSAALHLHAELASI